MLFADDLAAAVGTETANELTSALSKIKHCLGQLNDEQVWGRSQPSHNSIGNLILHLCGNLRQWIIVGLGGGADVRNRPAEFAERGLIPKDELVRKLAAVVEESKAVLARQTARQLLEARRIQGFDVTGLGMMEGGENGRENHLHQPSAGSYPVGSRRSPAPRF
jgi:hypothetical protein